MPAHVGCTLSSPVSVVIGTKTTVVCSPYGPTYLILSFHQAATIGQWLSPGVVLTVLANRSRLSVMRYTVWKDRNSDAWLTIYYPAVEVVPLGPWRHLYAIRELDIIMSIGRRRLLVGITKPPVLMDRKIQPILSGDVFIMFQSVQKFTELYCRMSCRVLWLQNLVVEKMLQVKAVWEESIQQMFQQNDFQLPGWNH